MNSQSLRLVVRRGGGPPRRGVHPRCGKALVYGVWSDEGRPRLHADVRERGADDAEASGQRRQRGRLLARRRLLHLRASTRPAAAIWRFATCADCCRGRRKRRCGPRSRFRSICRTTTVATSIRGRPARRAICPIPARPTGAIGASSSGSSACRGRRRGCWSVPNCRRIGNRRRSTAHFRGAKFDVAYRRAADGAGTTVLVNSQEAPGS